MELEELVVMEELVVTVLQLELEELVEMLAQVELELSVVLNTVEVLLVIILEQ